MTRSIIVLGPNAWGKGKTEREAMKRYEQMRYVRTSHEVIVIDADEGATVDDFGTVERPHDAEPSKEIKRVQVAAY